MASTTEREALGERLRVLEDEQAIRRVMARNQWRKDGADDGARSLSWEADGAVRTSGPDTRTDVDYWAVGGTWRGSGLSSRFDDHASSSGTARKGFSSSRARWMPQMMHFLTNEDIEVLSESRAHGRWYSWEPATVLVDRVHVAIWIAGRYLVDFEKQDGAWRIATMHFQEVFSTPVDGPGWTHTAHVPYGPGQLRTDHP
jgi:hypothetical protein